MVIHGQWGNVWPFTFKSRTENLQEEPAIVFQPIGQEKREFTKQPFMCGKPEVTWSCQPGAERSWEFFITKFSPRKK
jgi:hypothetical protein